MQAQLTPDLIFAATGIPFTLGTNALNTVFTDPFGRSTNRETSVVVSQKAYQYDANGNMTNDGRMAYFWNDDNRLVAVRSAKTGALIQENRYDGLGRRRDRVGEINIQHSTFDVQHSNEQPFQLRNARRSRKKYQIQQPVYLRIK
jgi:hypothetical protein